ncbi:hypothetical protein COV24_01265 [candidate division WWE3 bacterium CG10_big_fil_rev_8_21_14_0_10_32_10]|uniref:Baseplate protein J-like domain-containing protein n=1 Tax=candidate division WWE3 bacterium CG10_big_fil_rev_8_21_14_0_10_32_10 TaxID=1975090 RepID=A0A2H0RAY3_UNCKA|nr:MAG: hypothetical protein COV24_01265 [candidate division WWE3 bacterium CG10_big_fil_rev_8_21_14_0_10_32_10]
MNSDIIKIKKEYELGDILSQIRKSASNKIILQVAGDAGFLEEKTDLRIINNFAEKLNKNIIIQDTRKLEKLGFLAGEDVSTLNETPKSQMNSRKKIKLKVSSLNIFKKSKLPIILIIIVITSALLISGASAAYYYLPKANVVVKLDSQVFTGTKEVTVNLDTKEIDEENKIIPGILVSATTKDELTEVPTGEKEIGDKAVGEIEIFNKTDKKLKVSKDALVTIEVKNKDDEVIRSQDYVTDSDIEIPEKTQQDVTNDNGDIQKADVYGSKKVTITATSFGEDYNIDTTNVNFKIEGVSKDKIVVEIKEKMSGGSSKKVTVVSEKDQEDLKDKLTKKLEEKVKQSLESKIIDSQQLLDGAVDYNIVSTSFDKEIDEEADKFTVTMEIEASAIVYTKDDLLKVLDTVIKDLVPQNYAITEKSEQFNLVSTVKEKIKDEETDKTTGLLVTNKIQSYVVPKIDEEEIKNNLEGKTLSEAEDYLGSISNIKQIDITITPNLPKPLKRMPRIVKNINIDIQTESQ